MTINEQFENVGNSFDAIIEDTDTIVEKDPTMETEGFLRDVRHSIVLGRTWASEMYKFMLTTQGDKPDTEVPENLLYNKGDNEELVEVDFDDLGVTRTIESEIEDMKASLKELSYEFGLILLALIKTKQSVPPFLSANVQRYIMETSFYLDFELNRLNYTEDEDNK